MLKLKHSFLLLVVALLAACGTQAELPEAAATAEKGLSQISAAELEQAFASSELSAQGGTWDKKKHNRFILKKVVEGHPKDPHQKYKLAVICEVPGKKHDLKVVAGAYLKNGQYKHFDVSRKYKKCAIVEFDYFGDYVKFKYENGKHYEYSDVEYEGYLHVWGKEREYKASKFFHVKHGESKFTTYNKYVKKDKTKVSIIKKFVDEYSKKEVHIDGEAKFVLICKDEHGAYYEEDKFSFGGKHGYYYQNKYHRNLDCYFKESLYDEHYELTGVHFVGVNYTNKYYDGKDYVKGDFTKGHDGYYTSPSFHIPSKGKLHFVIIDKVKKKEEEKKKLELVIKKVFKVGYDGKEVYPKDYELDIELICNDKVVADTSKTHYSTEVYADDLQGKHCEVKEKFVDDQYEVFQYSVAYDDGVKPNTTYNDCNTDRKDYCEFSRYDVDKDAKKLVIIIVNNVKEKKPKFELVVKKYFKEDYNGDTVHVSPEYLNLKLICGDVTIDIGDKTHYETDYYDLRGKHCELKEKIYDDAYQTLHYAVKYNDDEPKWNGCVTKHEDGKDYDYCDYSNYKVDEHTNKLIIIIIDIVKKKDHQPPATS